MGRTERWIKLRLHRRHPVVVELAEEAAVTVTDALVCAIDWLRQVDADAGAERLYTEAAVNAACSPPQGCNFCLAMLRIGWLERQNGRFRAVDPGTWFSDAARQRLKRIGDADRSTTDGDRSMTDQRSNTDRRTADQSQTVKSDDTRETTVPVRSPAGGAMTDMTASTDQVSVVLEDAAGREISSADAAVLAAREAGRPGLTSREQLEVMRMCRASGIARNNSGRALNLVRNVIVDGCAFWRRIRRQALDQGLPEGSSQHASYIFGCIRNEARLKTVQETDHGQVPTP